MSQLSPYWNFCIRFLFLSKGLIWRWNHRLLALSLRHRKKQSGLTARMTAFFCKNNSNNHPCQTSFIGRKATVTDSCTGYVERWLADHQLKKFCKWKSLQIRFCPTSLQPAVKLVWKSCLQLDCCTECLGWHCQQHFSNLNAHGGPKGAKYSLFS